MPVEVEWHDDSQRIMVFRLMGGWTWVEYEAALKRSLEMGQQVSHPFVGVVDLSQSNLLPPGSFFLNARASLQYRPPTALHTLVVVGANSLFQNFGNAYHRIYGQRGDASSVFVATFAEGIAKAEALLDGSP